MAFRYIYRVIVMFVALPGICIRSGECAVIAADLCKGPCRDHGFVYLCDCGPYSVDAVSNRLCIYV